MISFNPPFRHDAAMPHPVIIGGVAGCGKTRLATGLAAATGWPFVEGDDLHPAANIALMAAGIALTDDNRAPWLDRIAAQLAAWQAAASPGIISCSALRRRYRDRLRAAAPATRFVMIDITPELARARLAARTGHFMPASLVASQFAALEPPDADEAVIRLCATLSPEAQIAAVRAALA
jgi:carbohydrate kinase (thermoresistant glucokinase family)